LIPYIGDFVANSTVRYFFGTNASTGASVNRTTAGAIRVYKNTSVTERTSVAGITDTSGFDSVTGLNGLSIDLSNNTDAGFYAAGNDYVVVLVGAVIDTQTVNVPLFQFSIENRYPSIANAVWNALLSSHVTANTFGARTVRTLASSPTSEMQINGQHHVSANVHQFQNNVITDAATDATFLAEVADAVWDEIAIGHTTADSFGRLLDNLASVYTGITGVVTNTINATYSSFSTNLSAINDTYNEQTIVFTTGDCAGQSVPVTSYTQTNGYITTEDPFTSEPQPGDVFSIIPIHIHKRTQIADALLNRLLDSSGSSFDAMNERTVRSALRAMRNRIAVQAGNITVYKENDQDAAWEGTLSNTAEVVVNPDGGVV
jgi:hypothetical protein